MSASVTRRVFASLLLAATASACVEGKLVHTINFELGNSAVAQLNASIAAFANANRFKGADQWEEDPIPYWPTWTLTSDDIDIQISMLERPFDATGPLPGPLPYAAHFYDHSGPLGGSARLPSVIAAFTRLLGGIEGVRKVDNEQRPSE